MNKPLLKFGMVDYIHPIDKFFIEVLSKEFTVERNDENPDYLFFCDNNFGNENVKFNNRKVIKIFYTGENARPFDYYAHHAISFDHLDGKHFYRMPLYVIDNWVNSKILKMPDVFDIKRKSTAAEKTAFCSFIVKNGRCEERNNFFHNLSKYKRIDSGGPLFKNTDELTNTSYLPGLEQFHYSKRDFLQKRKFNICYENASHPGYVTEKLFHALTYNTIPIYWGSTTVEMDFNTKAFISRHDFDSEDEMIKKIIELDNDDEKYNEMLNQPILNPRNKNFNIDRFLFWFKNCVYKGVINP